jgi:hypothetical protein
MGPWSVGVMDVQLRRRAPSHAWEVIPRRGPELPFRHVQGVVARGMRARHPDPERRDTPIRSCFPPRVFHVGAGVLPEVRMEKSRSPLLRIAALGKVLPCGEPLRRRQGLVPCASRGGPSRSPMDDPGFGGDEAVLAAAFLLAASPAQLPMPRIPGDDVTGGEEAGGPIIIGPPAHHRLARPQAGLLIPPGPGAGRQGLARRCDLCRPLRCRPEMDHPAPRALDPLEVKAQAGAAFMHGGDMGVLRCQLQVECGLQEVFDRGLERLDLGNPAMAHDDQSLRNASPRISAATGLTPLLSCVWSSLPWFHRP